MQTSPEKRIFKKKSGFFQNHSPFRRKSVKEVQPPANRNTWHARSAPNNGSPVRRPQLYNAEAPRTQSPEPIDANASVALGVGQNVLPVQTNRPQPGPPAKEEVDENDPIAQALAELKGVTLGKQSSVRMSADHYHGIATPAPGSEAAMSRAIPAPGSRDTATAARSTPPPSYQQPAQQPPPVSRLGVPPPAVTSKAMKEATKKATHQTRSIFGDNNSPSASYGTSPTSRPGTRGNDIPRAKSPAPARSASPQPQRNHNGRRMDYRSASPNPYQGHQQRDSSYGGQSSRGSGDYYRQSSPNESGRGASPASYRDYQRPQSSYGGSDMAVQLAPVSDDGHGSYRGRGTGRPDSRAMGLYNGDSRQRSKSVADPSRQYTRDGRPILHYGKHFKYVKERVLVANTSYSAGHVHVPGSHPRGTRLRQGRLPSRPPSPR